MPEINIVRTIKPKKGLYIAEGRSEYVGKHPVGEVGSGFWVGFKIVWRGGFFRSESGLLVLPHFCLGVSSLSDKKVQSEARWGGSRPASKALRSASAHWVVLLPVLCAPPQPAPRA